MSQTIGGRLAYADLLRCTAMLAVIVVHITGGALEASPVGTPDFMVLNVYDGLTHWCVPVFVMLSGMFLLDPKRCCVPSCGGQAGGISTGFSCWYLFSPSSCPPFCACGPARR